MWKNIDADGCKWQVRTISNPDLGAGANQEVLEFLCEDGTRPPRRLVIDQGSLGGMSESQLRAAYLQARPIGGDHYGRPGKQMSDAALDQG
jgi:hypothetical protein